MKIVKPSATLLRITSDAKEIIERAGRVCYRSEDKIAPGTAEKLIQYLKKMEHFSVFEHASASILFVCDRGVSHEMVRHRVASYSMESTRYCNYQDDRFGNEITVIEPPFSDNSSRLMWIDAMKDVEQYYIGLLKLGQTPQLARAVLPNSLKTEIVMTANFREWLRFFELRCAKAAHPQMQEVAKMAQEILVKEVPEVFA
jgi:thymidylate synthase (FAD)